MYYAEKNFFFYEFGTNVKFSELLRTRDRVKLGENYF